MADQFIGVIGCGKQGEKHVEALRALGATVVLADADAKSAQALSARTGCQSMEVDALLGDTRLGGVVIATPTVTHFDLASRALRNGKHVLCEKPLARDLAEAEALAQIEQETGRHLVVGFLYRYVPAFERMRELGQSGTLGPAVHAVLRIGGRGDHRVWKHQRATGGGVLNEMAVHMLDLALFLFGPLSRPQVVTAEQRLATRKIGGQETAVDADDYLVLRAETESGAPILVLADMVSPGFIQYVDAQYENASAMASIGANPPARLFVKEARGDVPAGDQPIAAGGVDLYRRQATAFLALVETGQAPDRGRIADAVAVTKLTEEFAVQMTDMSRTTRVA